MRLRLLASRPWRIALGILAIALPATADAPPAQYLRFDGSTSEITDQFTGLHWDRRGVQTLPRMNAALYCNSTVFPGAGRLPTVKELLTLVDEDGHMEYDTSYNPPVVVVSIDRQAFPKGTAPIDQPYWTSTPAAGGKFWTVDFRTGRTDTRAADARLNVRCVR